MIGHWFAVPIQRSYKELASYNDGIFSHILNVIS